MESKHALHCRVHSLPQHVEENRGTCSNFLKLTINGSTLETACCFDC
jgi:hypothetical protein